mgnify:CR=1 FL=1
MALYVFVLYVGFVLGRVMRFGGAGGGSNRPPLGSPRLLCALFHLLGGLASFFSFLSFLPFLSFFSFLYFLLSCLSISNFSLFLLEAQ